VGRANIQRMTSGEIYLDLGGASDGAPVTAYVSRWNAGQFFDIGRLDGKLVAVSGDIGSFRYRPEIFVTDPGQIAMAKAPVTQQVTPQMTPTPRPRWIHIDLKQMQHRQNHDRP
jgi:hypothetical protein